MSLVLPSAVALLAHKRLTDAVEALERKARADVADVERLDGSLLRVPVRDTERRVLALARAALAMFEGGEKVDAPPHLPVGPRMGRFTVLGAAGFELPAYTGLFSPEGAWVAGALRRGNPDPALSNVVVGTTQLAVRAGERALALTAVDTEQARIRAFSMGMLAAVASGVVVSPVLRGLESRRSRREWERRMPALDIADAEARVHAELLGGAGAAAMWQGWWPATDEIPDALLQGYVAAVEEAYGFGAAGRVNGFGEHAGGFEPGPPLTPERLRNAYAFLRADGAIGRWGMGTWFGVLTPALLMPSIGLIIVRALPHGQRFFSDSGPVDEQAIYEALTVGLGLGALPPFVASMYLWSQVPEHTSAFVNALVLFLARAGLTGTALGTLDAGAGVRWGLLMAPLLGTDVYALIQALRLRGSEQPGQAVVFALQTIPAMTAAAVLLPALLMKAVGVNSDLAFWLLWALHTVLMLLAVGLPLSHALSKTGGFARWFTRDGTGLPLLDALAGAGRTGDPAGPALLFDDSTLWRTVTAGDPPPTLADLRYPAGPHAVVRVWWTGAGALQASHDEHTVTFKREDGSLLPVVLGPGARTSADVATALRAALPGLEAEPVDPPALRYDLPFPHLLADPGDPLATLAEHDAHRGDFVPVGTTREAPLLLRHAPRVEQTTAYGTPGASRSAVDAIPVVPSRTLGDLEDTALGTAADLTVLLALGAAPSLARTPITAADATNGAPLPGGLGPVYQVFRQWNLDERRVNEWRMLVRGGAASEKKTHPEARDAAMRPDPAGPAAPYASSAGAAGEPIANALGWVPLWRAWLRMASDVTADSTSTSAAAYTPAVPGADGRRVAPANQDLTNAMRFLLDLP